MRKLLMLAAVGVALAGLILAGLAVAYASIADWSGGDCPAIASGDASYCQTDDCKGIVKRDKSYCQLPPTRSASDASSG